MKRLLTVVVILTLTVHKGYTLSCYECDAAGYLDNKCGDPFSSSNAFPRDCAAVRRPDGNFTSYSRTDAFMRLFGAAVSEGGVTRAAVTHCIKTVSSYNGALRTFRYCNVLGPDAPCSKVQDAVESDGGKLEFCEICNKNFCNGGQRPLVTFTLIVMVVLRSLL